MKYLLSLTIILQSHACLSMHKRKQPEPPLHPVTSLQCKSLFKGKSVGEYEKLDAECFIKGYSHFFITTDEHFSQNIPLQTKARSKINHLGVSFPYYRLNKQTNLHLFFIDTTEHQALLFLKYLLEQNLKNFTSKPQEPEVISLYIYGTLTGTSEDEIEKAYQLEDFIFRHSDFLSTQVTDVWADLSLHKQSKWPTTVKRMFELYKSNVWPKVKTEKYETQKKSALEWLNQNRTISNPDLKKQIHDLLEQLKQHSF